MTDKIAMLNPSRIQEAAFRETRWRVEVERNTTIEQILHPLYWGHVSRQLKPHDRITAVTDDNSAWYDLLVLSVGTERAYVALVDKIDVQAEMERIAGMDKALPEAPMSASVEWKGPQAKYCVMRGQTTVQKGFGTKAEAQQWIGNNPDQKAA